MACTPKCMGQRPTFVSMMFLTGSFFFVEIIVGYMTNSMALVADSFHMLSDIVSLFVGFFALKFSRKTSTNTLTANTFGFVRAEVLGALVNAVFLIALCFSILVEALKRLFTPEELHDAILILSVGASGLVINLLGMLLFHGHAGGHGHSHGGGHGHSHAADDSNFSKNENEKNSKKARATEMEAINQNPESKSDNLMENSETIVTLATCKQVENDISIEMYLEKTPQHSSSSLPEIDEGDQHKKRKVKSSGQMNMKGVYLHILGDALGSVIVIIAALLIHFFDGKWTLYVDPVLSIVMVLIILKTTIPLLKESSRILLQNVPSHIQVNQLEKRLLGSFPEIIEVHEFHVWQLTGHKIIASVHVKLQNTNTNYKSLSESLKEFFHKEGIHSTTVQPEFVENDGDNERQCLLACVSKACEEKSCCNKREEDKIFENINASSADTLS